MTTFATLLLTLAVVPAALAWTGRWRIVTVSLTAAVLAVVTVVALAAPQNAPAVDLVRALLLTATLALAVLGGGPLTTTVFGLVDGQHPDEESMEQAGSVLRGGAWIGALERAAVFATLVAGWAPGLAVVLGIKGLGRYPELRNDDHPGTAERFIIGTFTSVLWAVACAGVARLLS